MDEVELFHKIRELMYAVPSRLHTLRKPDKYWRDEEWAVMRPGEKFYFLVQDLIEHYDQERYEPGSRAEEDSPDVRVLELGRGPRFWTHADEEMFFTAIRSMVSFVKIVGSGLDLYLYYRSVITDEEKEFLAGLLKRYGMKIPDELKIQMNPEQ